MGLGAFLSVELYWAGKRSYRQSQSVTRNSGICLTLMRLKQQITELSCLINIIEKSIGELEKTGATCKPLSENPFVTTKSLGAARLQSRPLAYPKHHHRRPLHNYLKPP